MVRVHALALLVALSPSLSRADELPGASSRPRWAAGGAFAPYGYAREERPRWALVVGGALTLAAGSGLMALMAPWDRRGIYALPFAGPIVAYVELPKASLFRDSDGFRTLYGVAVTAQLIAHVAGTLMLIFGFADPVRTRVRAQVALLPGAVNAPLGASVVGCF